MTRNGFFGSSNFDWGANTRAEEGSLADSYQPAGVDYARYLRWGELKTQYYGSIDAAVGRTMEADTYDSYLGKILPDARTICGEPEHATPDLRYTDKWALAPCGATDAKVCTRGHGPARPEDVGTLGAPQRRRLQGRRVPQALPHLGWRQRRFRRLRAAHLRLGDASTVDPAEASLGPSPGGGDAQAPEPDGV